MLFRRRDMIAFPIAALASAAKVRTAFAQPTGKLVKVNGRRFWVEDYGPKDASVLLYIHGGPGMGVFEFSHYMRDHLARSHRLILIDQRGTLRSDPLVTDELVSYDRIALDFETIRDKMNINQWSIFGHSWGGAIALHYATAYPKSVATVILENPVIDPAATGRNMLGWTAVALETAGRKEEAAKARTIAEQAPQAMWKQMDNALNLLPSRQALYVYDPSFLGFYGRLSADAGLPDQRWEQGIKLAEALFSQASTFEPAQAKLDKLHQPVLVLRGQFDPSTSPHEMAAMTAMPNTRVTTVPVCSHFVHVENPARTATEIARIVRA